MPSVPYPPPRISHKAETPLDDEAEQFTNFTEGVHADFNALHSKVNSLTSDVSELALRMDTAMRRQFDSIVYDVKSKFMDQNTELAGAMNAVILLEQRISKLELVSQAFVSELNQIIDAHRAEILQNKADFHGVTAQLQHKFVEVEKNAGATQQLVARLEARLAAVENRPTAPPGPSR